MIKNIIFSLVCSTLLFSVSMSDVYAKPCKGVASMQNGLAKAKELARKDAYRTFIGTEVGTKVTSETQVLDHEVVSDYVSTHTQGYVLTKGVIREGQKGNLYEVILDLEAGPTPLPMSAQDIKGQLNNVAKSSSRYGIDVAVVDSTDKSTSKWQDCIVEALNLVGYEAKSADEVRQFILENLNLLSDGEMNTKARIEGKINRFNSNAILRGRIELKDRAEKDASGQYVATAEFHGAIVGYDNNDVDAVVHRVTGVGSKPRDAEYAAKRLVVFEAIDQLAKQSAKTIQRESGSIAIQTMFVFKNVGGASNINYVLNTMSEMGCNIIRDKVKENGDLIVMVSYSGDVNNADQLGKLVKEKLGSRFPSAKKMEDNSTGVGKQVIKLW